MTLFHQALGLKEENDSFSEITDLNELLKLRMLREINEAREFLCLPSASRLSTKNALYEESCRTRYRQVFGLQVQAFDKWVKSKDPEDHNLWEQLSTLSKKEEELWGEVRKSKGKSWPAVGESNAD